MPPAIPLPATPEITSPTTSFGSGTSVPSCAVSGGPRPGAVAASLPFKLESLGVAKSREQNPYVLNVTDFVPEVQATRSARELKAENEVLRACLKDARSNPKAFESYLRRSTQTTL